MQAEAANADRAGEGERAAHRAACRGQPRPADAARVDPGRGHEPAQRRDRLGPGGSKELLQTIDEEAERLNTLVGNLLDMSRLQTGSVTITAQPIGIEEIVASAIVGLHVPPDRIEVDVPETLPRVDVDPTLLERAVANLIDNALSFSPEDEPVRVEAAAGERRAAPPRRSTPGPGIPVADRERVFQPFQRLGDNPNGAGVGLGLAVAKGFVNAVGGDLVIEDTPGGGCTMVDHHPDGAVVTPLAADRRRGAVRARDGRQPARAWATTSTPRRPGAAGLAKAATTTPDVIVLDLGLPDMDGLEVLNGLRAWTAVPVIVLSARDRDDAKVAALDGGADDYVTKPFSMDELLARIRAALRRRPNAVSEEPVVETDDFRIDLAAKEVTVGGELGAAHADGVERARGPRPQPGQARLAAPAAQGGVGTAVRDRDRVPARVPRRPSPQARADAVAAPLLHHRAGHGLPLPAVDRQRAAKNPLRSRAAMQRTSKAPSAAARPRVYNEPMKHDGRIGIGVSVGSMGAIAAAAGLVAVRDHFAQVNAVLILVFFVLLGAVIGGRLAGVASALTAAVAFDFFYTQPYNSLKINSAADIETTILLLAVGSGDGRDRRASRSHPIRGERHPARAEQRPSGGSARGGRRVGRRPDLRRERGADRDARPAPVHLRAAAVHRQLPATRADRSHHRDEHRPVHEARVSSCRTKASSCR